MTLQKFAFFCKFAKKFETSQNVVIHWEMQRKYFVGKSFHKILRIFLWKTCKNITVKPICDKLICVQNNLQKFQSSIFIDMLTVQMSWINWRLFWNTSFYIYFIFYDIAIFCIFLQICKKIWNFSKWCNSLRNAKKIFCGQIIS